MALEFGMTPRPNGYSLMVIQEAIQEVINYYCQSQYFSEFTMTKWLVGGSPAKFMYMYIYIIPIGYTENTVHKTITYWDTFRHFG